MLKEPFENSRMLAMDTGAQIQVFLGGCIICRSEFFDEGPTWRLQFCKLSLRINGINSNTADFSTCTCIQRTTKNKLYVL